MNAPGFSFIGFIGNEMSLPYVSMGDIAFEVISDKAVTAVVMVGMDGRVVEETNRSIVVVGGAYFIRPQFASRPDCFRLMLKSNEDLLSGQSNVFVLVDDEEYSSRLEYRSGEDNFGFTYRSGWFNAARLPLYLKEPKFSQSREVYATLSGRQKILSASVRDEYDLETDYMCEDMHRKLIIALMHDEVYIDGRLLTQTGDYSVDWDNYLMDGDVKTAKGKCTVSANVVSRSSNCG